MEQRLDLGPLEEAAPDVVHEERREVRDEVLREERGSLPRRHVERPPQRMDLVVDRGRRLARVSSREQPVRRLDRCRRSVGWNPVPAPLHRQPGVAERPGHATGMAAALSYLVTSRARRELLRQLWVERAVGSVSDLAHRAGVSFAAAHKELESMRAEGLATSERVGRMLQYQANRKHLHSELLRRLLSEGATGRTEPSARAEQVRGWLAALGAPLLVTEAAWGRPPSLEEVVAQGLVLSHEDATVARVLPVVLWTLRDRLDPSRLVREATRVDERQTLGFFLELTGRLARNERFASLSSSLRDRRRSRVRPFFARAHGRMALATARKNTPPVVSAMGLSHEHGNGQLRLGFREARWGCMRVTLPTKSVEFNRR